MLDFSLSWLPFLIVAVANFVVSWLSYSPAAPWFGTWQKGVGMDPSRKEMTDAERRAMPRLFGGAIVGSLLGDGRHVDVRFISDGSGVKVVEEFEAEKTNPPELQRQGWQAILDSFRKYVEGT